MATARKLRAAAYAARRWANSGRGPRSPGGDKLFSSGGTDGAGTNGAGAGHKALFLVSPALHLFPAGCDLKVQQHHFRLPVLIPQTGEMDQWNDKSGCRRRLKMVYLFFFGNRIGGAGVSWRVIA